MINTDDLLNLINKAVYEQVRMPVSDAVNKLLNNNVNLTNIIESSVINAFKNELNKEIGNINVTKLVEEKVDEVFKEHISNTKGLSVTAEETELSVLDGVVVVENELVTTDAKVVNDLQVDNWIVVKNLQVTDRIDQSTDAWKTVKEKIVKDVIETFTNTAIDKVSKRVLEDVKSAQLDLNNATLSGKKLLTEDSLKDIEELNKLKVNGEAQINDTFYVANKRVGINTEVPAMGLSVWDEEVNVLAGKLKEKTGFVGTANQQRLAVGVNRREDIAIDEEGVVKVNKLQLGQNRVRFEDQLPGYKGTKGDITFNTNINKDDPVFAWVCLSGHNWLPLKG